VKLGDFVSVCYYDQGISEWTTPFHGFICMTPNDHADAVWQMWCIERNTFHILSPHKDRIEVVSEA